MKKKKIEYAYLVYCNPDPIVYAVYRKKQDAVRHAIMLIRYRRDRAIERKYSFEYYHFRPYCSKNQTEKYLEESKIDPITVGETVFSACLSIDDPSEWSDDSCMIQVDRRILR